MKSRMAERFEDALRHVGKGDPLLGQILPRVFENACSTSTAHAVGRTGRERATVTEGTSLGARRWHWRARAT
jgi:hypothetical protein